MRTGGNGSTKQKQSYTLIWIYQLPYHKLILMNQIILNQFKINHYPHPHNDIIFFTIIDTYLWWPPDCRPLTLTFRPWPGRSPRDFALWCCRGGRWQHRPRWGRPRSDCPPQFRSPGGTAGRCRCWWCWPWCHTQWWWLRHSPERKPVQREYRHNILYMQV